MVNPKSSNEFGSFVNRKEFFDTFSEHVKNIGDKTYSVLVYYGVGGIGKTSLIKELPKLLEEYNLSHREHCIIWVSIDFEIESHRQRSNFLTVLKSELQKKYGIKFNLFEIAQAIYRRKVYPLTPLQNDVYTENGIISDLLDNFGALATINYENIKKIVDNAPDRFKKWFLKRKDEIVKLISMEPVDIEKQLTDFWIQDLTDHLQNTSSYAIFFIDSYEALWEQRRRQGNFISRDIWIRNIISKLPRSCLWVICGRESLRWEENDEESEKNDVEWKNYLEQYQLKNLPKKDAFNFVSLCGIEEEDIQKTIIEESDGFPFYLELSIDSYKKIAKKRPPEPKDFRKFPKEIFTRFIKYLDDSEIETLKLLSSLRFWDQDIFEELINHFKTGYPLTAFSDLNKFSFIQNKQNKFELLPLVRQSFQINQDKKLKQKVHEFMLKYYTTQLNIIDIKNITIYSEEFLKEAFYHAKEALKAEELLIWIDIYSDPFYKAALLQLIAPMYEETLKNISKDLGPENNFVVAIRNKLSEIYLQMGDYKKALSHYKKAIKIVEDVIGEENPESVELFNNFAEFYYQMGEYEKALPLYEKALKIAEKIFGESQPNSAKVLNNIAALYSQIGELEKALPIFQKVLTIQEKTLGLKNPDVALTLNNLAKYYHQKGEYEKSLPLYKRALEIIESVMGENHPKRAIILNNLAEMYSQMGDFEKALLIYQQVLTICEKTLGPDHPNIAATLNNLAGLHEKMGDYKKALNLYQRALDTREKTLGKDHPDVAQTLNNLALLHESMREYEKALPLYERALKIYEIAFSSQHPDFATTLHNQALLYESMEAYDKALSLYQQAFDIREKVLGLDHPDTAATLNNLAILYERIGKYEEALTLYERALNIYEKIFGPYHPDIAATLNNLALLYVSMEEYEKALSLYQQALDVREKVFGLDHPDTAATLNNLAGVYSHIGMYEEALPLYTSALSIYENIFGTNNRVVANVLINMAKIYSVSGLKEKPRKKGNELKKIPHIEQIILKKYREYPKEPKFEFGRVNLICGPNGSGKTSLLEAIELFLCGKNYRNPENVNEYRIKVRYNEQKHFEEMDLENTTLFKIRNSEWYSYPYDSDMKDNNLFMNFNRFNFFDTDAAVRLSTENSLGKIKEAFEDISLGENVNYIEKRLKDFKFELDGEMAYCTKLHEDHSESIDLLRNILDNLNYNIEINHLFKTFIEKALEIRWLTSLPKSVLDSFDHFETDYNRAKTYIKEIFKNTYWVSDLTPVSLQSEKKNLDKMIKSIKIIDTNIDKAEENLGNMFEGKYDTTHIVSIENNIIEEEFRKKEEIINSFFDHFKPISFSNFSRQDSFEAFLQIKIKQLDYSIQLLKRLSQIITILPDESLKKLDQDLECLSFYYEKFRAETNKKMNLDKEIEVVESKIQYYQKKLDDISNRKNAILQAYSIIEDILKNNSKGMYLRNFMEKNKGEIFRIFNAIHSPNEFEDVEFNYRSNIVLKRLKQSSEYAELSKISTGQRSALALSVFLSLNSNLKNGPPYLIFDDPISFIDDLNVLSFIDYLREIALNTDRQIFLATANEDLAFLISKKFEFLGDSEFKVIKLGR